MSRLFITQREIDFINDINKEIIKDVIGQKVYYYSISYLKSFVHDIYQESPEKIFEKPVEIDALVEWKPEDIRTNTFGTESVTEIEVFIHQKDLYDKKIEVTEGDFVSYGTHFYEITSKRRTSKIYGQIEHTVGIKLTAKESRKSNFIAKVLGPTDINYSDPDARQGTFYQQRGFEKNQLGETGDIRDLQKNNVLDEPLTGPSEVSPRGPTDGSESSESFYDEQD